MIFKIVFLCKHHILKNHIRIFFLFFFIAVFSVSYCQEPIYQNFSVDEGLPSSQVYDAYQTKDGYIWFGTDKGLSRYNGYEFENFDINDGLSGNVILRFYPQKNGQVWAYSYHNKSLFYFNEYFNGFTIFRYNKVFQKELKSISILKSLFVDSFNTLHIAGANINGIISITEKGEVSKKYDTPNFFDKDSTEQKYIVLNDFNENKGFAFITSDETAINKKIYKKKRPANITHVDALWLHQNARGVFMEGNTIEIIDNKKIKKIKAKNSAIGIKVIDSSLFFAGYIYGGAKIINDEGVIVKEYLKEESVTNLLIDHEGGYWFTTLQSGIYYIKNTDIVLFKSSEVNKSLHVNSLVKRNDELLVGYKNGAFVIIENKKINFPLRNDKTFKNSSTIVEYDKKYNKTFLYENSFLKINNSITDSIYVTKFSEPTLDGKVYAIGINSFFDFNTSKTYEFKKRVQDVSIWKKDTLIATPFGIYKKNKDDIIALSKESNLLSYRSDDIDVSKNGKSFYIATQGAGVVVYGEKIYNISSKDGLTSNIVNQIHVENDSTIYACTNEGINRIIFKNNDFKISFLNKSNGLLSNEVADVEIVKDTLWVGTKDGLCYFPKKAFESILPDSIFLKLKQVKVNEEIYNLKEKPTLAYNHNKISFLVEGITFANNVNLEYKYRLKDVDDHWIKTKNRNISFLNLKNGEYTFQVKACLGIKCYEESVLEYSFLIPSPFWKSWWFYSFYLFVFVGIIYLFFKIRVFTYNKDIVREFIRLLIKQLKRNEKYLEIRMNGESIKLSTDEILFVKSSGNYLDIITTNKTFTIRCKIGDFIATTPDALEYLRVHRSYIIRIDKVSKKSKNSLTIKEHKIPVGETYLNQLNNIHF